VAGNAGYLTRVIQAQVVAAGTIAPLLGRAASGAVGIDAVVAQETGSAFAAQARAATVGTLRGASSVANVLTGGSNLYGTANQSADAAFIRGLYRTVLGRDPGMLPADASGNALSETQFWLNQMSAGMTHEQVAYGFVNSLERRTQEVNAYYQTLLGRDLTANPDPAAVYWVDVLLGGAGESRVVAGIMASAEYRGLHPDDADYVTQVYANLLGRGPGATEVAGVTRLLQAGASRGEVALGVAQSPEASRVVVVGDYAAYLHRQPDAASEAWVSGLAGGGLTLGQVTADILGDPYGAEFYANGKAFVSSVG
jgi:hypothetical protein